jgi:hypothetical protein
MEDRIVSFKIAKIAKECGFDFECKTFFKNDSNFEEFPYYAGDGAGMDKNSTCLENDHYNFNVLCIAPTQSLLQRWLREVHNIHICMIINIHSEYNKIYGYEIYGGDRLRCLSSNSLNTSYEEALELALFTALNLIKQ